MTSLIKNFQLLPITNRINPKVVSFSVYSLNLISYHFSPKLGQSQEQWDSYYFSNWPNMVMPKTFVLTFPSIWNILLLYTPKYCTLLSLRLNGTSLEKLSLIALFKTVLLLSILSPYPILYFFIALNSKLNCMCTYLFSYLPLEYKIHIDKNYVLIYYQNCV